MKIAFDRSLLSDFAAASQKEWLETNGLGGWASSSVTGAHTRRYHGLLVPATNPPVGRMVLLSRLDETVVAGEARYELGCSQFPGAVSPRGYQHLIGFSKQPFPVFDFEAGEVRLRKTIAAIDGENSVLVLFDVLAAPSPFVLELRPFIAARDYHSLAHANDAINREPNFDNGLLAYQAYAGAPVLYLQVPGASFSPAPDWYYNFEYAVEAYRGLDFREDLFTPGFFRITLQAGERLGIIASTEHPAGREAFALLEKERKRRQKLLRGIDRRDALRRALTLAADQFVVRRGQSLRTLIAGYHWFSDWGRDTMIALPGLCLVTGRHNEAKRIIRAFAASVSQGMLPNRFPDAGDVPEYNTVDATLWFFVAIEKYWQATHDDALVGDELLPVLRDILQWHERGTRYGIKVDSDGLLAAGEPGVQLTWMDAKVGDWVVTPRQGKAVEINALWYNALRIMAAFARRFGQETEHRDLCRRAEQVKAAFLAAFWNESQSGLYDYIDGDHRDAAIRPNQIFALSLPFALLDGHKAQQVLQIVESKLLTPAGLRSLAPEDPAYRPRYGGDPWSRDSAYHQGTVWAWLLGPYITALVRVRGEHGRRQAHQLIAGLQAHLLDGGLGTIAEIFDAEPPHTPRGCIAQAWSVAEILRAYVEDVKSPELLTS